MKKIIWVIIAGIFIQAYTQTIKFKGCTLLNAGSGTVGQVVSLKNTCNVSDIDRAFREEMNFMRAKFTLNPSFYYFDDSKGMNAFFTPETEDENKPDGTICFGIGLLQREFPKSSGGTAIPIIVAHEMGHCTDNKYNAVSERSGKTKELFADFIAGSYMYIRSFWKGTDINACLRTFYSLGDTNFGNPDHHGTPQERFNALLAGYYAARNANVSGIPLSLDDAVEKGKKYVRDV